MNDAVLILAQVCAVAVTTVAALTTIGFVAAAVFGRLRRGQKARQPLDDDRLRHLEQAVDAIAIEVERISEGQRFLAKLQTERNQEQTLVR